MLVSMFFFESKTASLTLSMKGVAEFYEDKYGQDKTEVDTDGKKKNWFRESSLIILVVVLWLNLIKMNKTIGETFMHFFEQHFHCEF